MIFRQLSEDTRNRNRSAPKKYLHLQVLFGLSGFRLSASGASGSLSASCADFVGRCAAVGILACRREGLRAFLHYYNYKSCVTAGGCASASALSLPCAGFHPCAAFLFTSGRCGFRRRCVNFAGIIFFAVRRAHALRSARPPKKFFRGYGAAGEGAFLTDFSFGKRVQKCVLQSSAKRHILQV